MNGRILWILGAGASKHLDLPLLAGFPQFLTKIKYDNLKNESLQRDCDQTLEHLSKMKGDIEQLLREHPIESDLGTVFRHCVRESFYLRHKAVFTIRDIRFKYKAYSYLLCLVEQGDSNVTFNYDTSIERTIDNAKRPQGKHDNQPRVPPECLDYVRQMNCVLQPKNIFDPEPSSEGTHAFSLIKLHGSINWNWNKSTRKLTARDSSGEPDNSFLVYPDAAKPEANASPVKDLFETANQLVNDTGRETGTGPVIDNLGKDGQLSGMPRNARVAPGGMVFHVLNRGVGKNKLFFNDQDFLAFERIIADTLEKRFMQRLTVTHVTRWQKNYNLVG